MNLDKLTVNVRVLSAYQAMDLGLAVARAWFLPLWRLWWSSGYWLVGALLLSGLLCTQLIQDDWGFLLYLLPIWWCKPMYERPLLIYLSQRLFDDDYPISKVKTDSKTMPSLRFMLIKRFSLQRLMVMPVYLLEGQTSDNAKTRLRLLTRQQGSAITWHSLAFFVVELVWYLAVGYLLLEPFGLSEQELQYQSTLVQALVALVELVSYVLIISVIAPFFVASGFMMYLCKRSLLEGWDIELTFRKLAYRYQHARTQSTHTQGDKP